ncbi:type II toxin-antitoxin system Phd/YefM family antitoxin [Nocardiopsis sp. LOL_012]|uniref:type II toxin-antitoxin system Phd/YefM family antitoxin n=1 Tax=Nocardiopsis sp. LOL_012 TaxID=3345409 RepID=UPI003A85FE18
MSITVSEARASLLSLIRRVNEAHEAVEIASKHGNAVLVSAEDYAALREGAYLLRSPENARRLVESYGKALWGTGFAERDLIVPDTVRTGDPG